MSERGPEAGSSNSDIPSSFGKYQVVEKIGAGGMAEIFKARMTGIEGFEKLVVVKKILPEYSANRSFIKMLIDEAKISSAMQHPNIVHIYDLGQVGSEYFIAMEYVDGKDLLKILARCVKLKRRIPLKFTLFIVAEVCKALAYAHAARDLHGDPLHIVHRDVSPANILVAYEGDVKIMDFGVARARTQQSKTRSGVLKGKLGYMSPEQVTGKEIDFRSDIFSIGIILYETITLKRLFLGRTDLETLINIRDVRIDKRLKKHSYIPEGIVALIRRALAADPSDRFPTAMELHDALMDFMYENRMRVRPRELGTFLRELFADELEEKERPPAPKVEEPPSSSQDVGVDEVSAFEPDHDYAGIEPSEAAAEDVAEVAEAAVDEVAEPTVPGGGDVEAVAPPPPPLEELTADDVEEISEEPVADDAEEISEEPAEEDEGVTADVEEELTPPNGKTSDVALDLGIDISAFESSGEVDEEVEELSEPSQPEASESTPSSGRRPPPPAEPIAPPVAPLGSLEAELEAAEGAVAGEAPDIEPVPGQQRADDWSSAPDRPYRHSDRFTGPVSTPGGFDEGGPSVTSSPGFTGSGASSGEGSGSGEGSYRMSPTTSPWLREDVGGAVSRPVGWGPDSSAGGSEVSAEVLVPVPEELMLRYGKSTFRLRDNTGNSFGPVSFANFISLIRSRAVSEAEMVSVDGGEWHPARALTGLRELQAQFFPAERRSALWRGEIQHVDVPKLMYRMWTSRVTGKLKFFFRSTQKEVFFKSGRPQYVSSNLKGELLGAYLVARRIITPEQLQTAIQRAAGTQEKLGDALVNLRYMQHHELFDALQRLHHRRFLQMFVWNAGSYQVFEREEPPSGVILLDLDVPRLIAEGVREFFGFDELKRFFKPYYERKVKEVSQGTRVTKLTDLRFNSQELRYFGYIEPGKTITDLLREHARLNKEALVFFRVLFLTLQMGFLKLH